jgi:hypothetical protein
MCASPAHYRPLLHRTLGEAGPSIAWVLLNPSTADETSDDPTLRRILGFSRRAHMATVTVVNLFTFRATRPRDLLAAIREGIDAIGPDAANALTLATQSDAIVMAWGRPANRAVAERTANVRRVLEASGQPIFTVGPALSGGHPRHPLYAPYAVGLCTAQPTP